MESWKDGATVLVMKYCEKDFVDQIGKILNSRERRVIEQPSLARAAVLVPLFKKGENGELPYCLHQAIG